MYSCFYAVPCCVATDKRSPSVPPAGSGQKDPMSELVDQLHCGVQLRPTARGNFMRNSAGQ